MKKILAFLALFAAAIMFMGTAPILSAGAAAVLPTDTSEPRSGCTFLGIEGKYITQIQESLDRINEIRLEACKEGVENPDTGKPLTQSDYVPIQWSADLEYIARLRAAEASVTMAHARTNGQSIWFKSPNGIQSYGEVIAWNWGETMTHGIEQWYGEKEDWVKKTGGVTGHYTSMIDPTNLYVGLGTFYSKVTKYPNTTAGEFCGRLNNPDTSRGSSTGYIIQTLEVKNDNISYNISGTDSLVVSAAVTFKDYWSNTLKTEGLVLLGNSAENIQWSSSDNNIVSVSNGRLTVKSCGSATVTAKLPDGTALTKPVSYQHSYEITTTKATCKAEGKIVKKCKICGDTSIQVIPKTNQHSYETTTTEATCKAEGKIVKKCKICGDTDTQVIPKTNRHSFGNWVITKAPTADSDGLEARTCAVCDAKETRTLQYKPQVGNPSSSSGSSSVPSSSGSSSVPSSSGSSSVPSSSGSSSVPSSSGSSSVSSSSGSSSVPSSSGSSSVPISSGSSSVSSSSNSSYVPISSGSSSVSSSSNETHNSDVSNNGNYSNMLAPIAIIAGVLFAAAVVLVICIVRQRKRK